LKWNFYSKLAIAVYCLLQVLRFPIFPQFIDIYYHLHTAWGFIQAGGYSGWDFWEYAPVGRPHIYPPLFHLILTLFIKLGAGKIILAKALEAGMPVVFLCTLWRIVRKNYGERLAFFVILVAGSSFSFYLSLINHLPATLAVILGFLAFDQLFRNKPIRAVILLALCFYTHIGISCFFGTAFFIYALISRDHRKRAAAVLAASIILSLPMLYKELSTLRFINSLTPNESNFCEFKIIEYALAIFGLLVILKRHRAKYAFFLSLFAASLLLLIYPYRYFSAQGYLPIILLAAVCLNFLYEAAGGGKVYLKYLALALAASVLFISPTLLFEKTLGAQKTTHKVYCFDSALVDMFFPLSHERAASRSLWFPEIYLPMAGIIKENTQGADIIYSSSDIVGVCLAGASGRACANALLPEVAPLRKIDPIKSSKIIIALKDDSPKMLGQIVKNYGLNKIGENKLFILYNNSSCNAKMEAKKASVPFSLIIFIGFLVIFIFWRGERLASKIVDKRFDL